MTHSRIGFQSVSKFYFVWVYLCIIHYLIFFYLPQIGNTKINQASGSGTMDYCTLNQEKCNNLNYNNYLIFFYLLCCLYLYYSAMMIKEGQPEVMQTYYPMNSFNNSNRYQYNTYMAIPFLFELRVFIDWSVTRTSLDVFQWIKLAQIQNDLWYAKSISQWYYSRTVGTRIHWCEKLWMGIIYIVIIIILLIGPLLVFSSALKDIGNTNPITKASLSVDI